MKKNIQIWGKQAEVEVCFDTHSGEPISPVQERALDNFVFNSKDILKDTEQIVAYCRKELGTTDDIGDIFDYVAPRTILVGNGKDNIRKIALICDSVFDVKNGVTLVFQNEVFSAITTQSSMM